MCSPKYFKIHYWPGFTFALFVFTFLVSYLISVLNGHVYGFFPYISDTGSIPPESCIFGQLFNFGALSMLITLYIRYRQVNFDIANGNCPITQTWNKMGLLFAGCICLGISIVGDFQETALEFVHVLGAFLVFGIGSTYFFIQTRISFAYTHNLNFKAKNCGLNKRILYIRLFITLCLFPLFLTCAICSVISRNEFKGKSILIWTEEDGGFPVHLASTFTEWIMVIFMFIYIVTYTNEFKLITFEEFKFTSKYNFSNNDTEIA